jgi:hypothetical protein
VIRATIYLATAGIVWLVEGFLFSYFLRFALWQTVLMAIIYVALFLIATRYLIAFAGRQHGPEAQIAYWRYLSLAPMLTVVVGSFASLPLLLAILALGHL